MRKKIVAAISALSHPSWTPAISGTAAAIALESAVEACAKHLIAEVTSAPTPIDLSIYRQTARWALPLTPPPTWKFRSAECERCKSSQCDNVSGVHEPHPALTTGFMMTELSSRMCVQLPSKVRSTLTAKAGEALRAAAKHERQLQAAASDSRA